MRLRWIPLRLWEEFVYIAGSQLENIRLNIPFSLSRFRSLGSEPSSLPMVWVESYEAHETAEKPYEFRVLHWFWLFVHLPLNAAALHWETHKRNVFTCFQTMCQIHVTGTTPFKITWATIIISTWSSGFWGLQIHPIRGGWWRGGSRTQSHVETLQFTLAGPL